MATHTPGRFDAGQTGLIVAVPEAEPVVGELRLAHDPVAALGIYAHVTVLFPFLPFDTIDGDVHAALTDRFAAIDAFDARFPRCARFPEWLYLEPVPDNGFRELTATVMAGWPQALPYGGAHDPVPHLSVARLTDDTIGDRVEAQVTPRLPVTSLVDHVRLVHFDGQRWHHATEYPLATA